MFFCICSVFHSIFVPAHAQNIGKFQMLEIYQSYINLGRLNDFTYFTFSKIHAISKVDVLPFLSVSGSLGLAIACKFKEWKRFAQLLVGMPNLAKLHMIEA